jgi:hypothetical protein
MILISHRGNLNGRIEKSENDPLYVDEALTQGYDVEIDVWYIKSENAGWSLFLGHDYPQYQIDFEWFTKRLTKLWVHCKNIESIVFFKRCGYDINFFWHQNDTVTLTSKKNIWAFPGKQPIPDSISVMPEIFNDDISQCLGVCSDYIKNYK